MQLWLGLIGAGIGVISYIPYFRDIFRGITKPHPFSWFVWGLVSAIAFFAQIFSGGGVGASATGITALACFTIAAVGVFRGERHIKKIDVVCFIGALIGILVWKLTANPVYAVVIVLLVHLLGFVPTFRKAYLRPTEETLSTYLLSLLKWGFGIAALTTITPATILFPIGVFVMNLAFSIMIVVRRHVKLA